MKHYNRSKERKTLHSLFNETMLDSNESGKPNTGDESKRRNSFDHRNRNARTKHKSGRTCKTCWCAKTKCESDNDSKKSCYSGSVVEVFRSYRSYGRIEDQEIEEIDCLEVTSLEKRSS